MIEDALLQAVDAAGRAMRIRTGEGSRVVVWTGRLGAIEGSPTGVFGTEDLAERNIVHFIDWDSARDYYARTPFAPMLELIRRRLPAARSGAGAADGRQV